MGLGSDWSVHRHTDWSLISVAVCRGKGHAACLSLVAATLHFLLHSPFLLLLSARMSLDFYRSLGQTTAASAVRYTGNFNSHGYGWRH